MFNQYEGNTNLISGNERIAGLIARLRESPHWDNMVIVITYDEFGPLWDHATPPKGNIPGPGTRIPAIIIPLFAWHGTADYTQYDTGSTLRIIIRPFNLPMLRRLSRTDSALVANGMRSMGDLTNALTLR